VEKAALLWSAPGGTLPRYATGYKHILLGVNVQRSCTFSIIILFQWVR